MASFFINEIQKLAVNQQTYEYGREYQSKHMVSEIHYDRATRRVHARVVDGKEYRVTFALRDDQSIGVFFCTCPAFFDYHGACKHVIAVLLEFNAQNRPLVPLPSIKNNTGPVALKVESANEEPELAVSQALIATLLHQARGSDQNQLKLQVTLHKDPAKPGQAPALELQIGLLRLYKVKNYQEFIEAVDHEKELFFGQTFTFQPKMQSFHPQNQTLIDFLVELYRDERNVWEHTDFNRDQFKLKPSQLRRFLAFAGTMPNAFWQKNTLDPARRLMVSQTAPPLVLQVSQGPQHVEIRLQNTELLLFLTPDKDIIVAQNQFYLLTPQAARCFVKLWGGLGKGSDHYLPLAAPQTAALLAELAPSVQEFCRLEIVPEVQSRMCKSPLTIVLCLDLYKEGIMLKLCFQYGAAEIDPLTEAAALPEGQLFKILALLTRLRQICCHPALCINHYIGSSGKLDLLLELVQDCRSGDHRILIFSQFVKMLDLIADQLQTEAIPYLRIDGQTPPEKRLKQVNDFNAGAAEIFLISLKAGGTGLNLTGADTVIHYDPWWNPVVENQATDRAYRMGQKKVVQVFKLVTQGTIEERVFALQQKKKNLIDNIINPGENFLGKMTLEEVRELFAD